MLSQTKKNKKCFSWNFFPKNRKGISLMIGYVLLMTVAVVMGILVYNWIKTYVPKEGLACPDEVSIFIEKAVYYEAESILDVTIKNNGNFNVAGYFIHATNSSEQELAIIDLSEYTLGGEGKGGAVLLGMGENSFKPNQKRENEFNLSGTGIGTIYSVEIIPVRYQEENNKLRFVSCGNAKVKEDVKEWEECVPDCTGKECGDDGCEGICPPDCSEEEEVCNSTGQCVPPEECIDTCDSLGYECGIWTICGIETTCPPGCEVGYTCESGQCIPVYGDGICVTEEDCSCPDCEGEQNGCLSGQICLSGSCVYCNYNDYCDENEDCSCLDCEEKKNGCEEGEMCQDGECVVATPISSCKSYCYYLGYSEINSHCALNCGGQCEGTCKSGGDEYCSSPTDFCCCVP
jgi:hypothetical protein